MKTLTFTILTWLLALFLPLSLAHASEELLEKNRKILVLGDSITQAGSYVSYFDAWLVKKYPDRRFTVVNAGVASETISGLSETGHAGGRFPRPDLHERLERVLEKTQPDLILACYGMNCGIYLELDDERFEKFKEGTRKLRAAAKQHGAEVVHVTPPIFDNRGKEGFDYDDVLTAYSKWLVEQRKEGWLVADLHAEMRAKADEKKKANSTFTYQGDRVHPNADGHWVMAQSLISFFGDDESAKLASPSEMMNKERLNAVSQRMKLYQKAIHAETKPLRPGVPKGGTLESAAESAKALEASIYGP